MNRRSVIKSIFTIAIAPKILSELELNSPLVQPKTEGFIGIIPSIRDACGFHNYELGTFTMNDLVRIYEQTGNLIFRERDNLG